MERIGSDSIKRIFFYIKDPLSFGSLATVNKELYNLSLSLKETKANEFKIFIETSSERTKKRFYVLPSNIKHGIFTEFYSSQYDFYALKRYKFGRRVGVSFSLEIGKARFFPKENYFSIEDRNNKKHTCFSSEEIFDTLSIPREFDLPRMSKILDRNDFLLFFSALKKFSLNSITIRDEEVDLRIEKDLENKNRFIVTERKNRRVTRSWKLTDQTGFCEFELCLFNKDEVFGKPEIKVVTTFLNGIKREKKRIVRGVPLGEWKVYNDSGKLYSRKVFKLGESRPNIDFFDESGRRTSSREFEKDGSYIEKLFLEEEQRLLIVPFRNNLRDGVCKLFRRNGSLLKIQVYREGIETGLSASFYENGSIFAILDTVPNVRMQFDLNGALLEDLSSRLTKKEVQRSKRKILTLAA